MRAAAEVLLRNHCLEIIEELAKSCIEGHIQSSRFLFDLADDNQTLGASETSERLHTLASELEAEPQWRERMSEEVAEAAGGSRAAEG